MGYLKRLKCSLEIALYIPKNNEAGFTMYNDKTTGENLFTTHEGGMDKESILKVLKEIGLE